MKKKTTKKLLFLILILNMSLHRMDASHFILHELLNNGYNPCTMFGLGCALGYTTEHSAIILGLFHAAASFITLLNNERDSKKYIIQELVQKLHDKKNEERYQGITNTGIIPWNTFTNKYSSRYSSFLKMIITECTAVHYVNHRPIVHCQECSEDINYYKNKIQRIIQSFIIDDRNRRQPIGTFRLETLKSIFDAINKNLFPTYEPEYFQKEIYERCMALLYPDNKNRRVPESDDDESDYESDFEF